VSNIWVKDHVVETQTQTHRQWLVIMTNNAQYSCWSYHKTSQ